MAEWGWRSPRKVSDPILGQILRSLERYLIEYDQGDAELAEATEAALDVLTDSIAALAAIVDDVSDVADDAAASAEAHSTLYGVDNGGTPEVHVRWTQFEIDGSDVFFYEDPSEVTESKAAFLGFDGGTPVVNLVGAY